MNLYAFLVAQGFEPVDVVAGFVVIGLGLLGGYVSLAAQLVQWLRGGTVYVVSTGVRLGDLDTSGPNAPDAYRQASAPRPASTAGRGSDAAHTDEAGAR